ncbi:hypothetical protein ACZ87_02781 [Candidatus Erwinia dacicola]|uniref:Uncharacterized protein n=1 Tax=Candidatus Erwinia dacicola TaxID=252393 RepID=A0A328TJZ6_9GAMM|nr:hypothetical protein ACZ87_02781 [Candidatus Erwinia dacicola]
MGIAAAEGLRVRSDIHGWALSEEAIQSPNHEPSHQCTLIAAGKQDEGSLSLKIDD